MKKAISAGLVAAMLASGAGSACASAPSTLSDACMHVDDMRVNGYWTNGEKPVCGCNSCQVVLEDYDHLDKVFDKSNASLFSKSVLNRLKDYIKNGDWKKGRFLLISADRKDETNAIKFGDRQNFSFENLDNEQQNRYYEAFRKFNDTINAIQEGDTSDEKAAQIIMGIKEMQKNCPSVEKNANKSKLAIVVLGSAASLASLIMGMKQVAKNPVPNYVENPNAKMTLKDAFYTSKLGLKTLAVIISSGLIIVGSFLLGDFAKNKVINRYGCPSLDEIGRNYFNYN